MGNLIAKPQVSFSEAVRLGINRLTDFRGRSRRSEFWWFMLAFYIATFFVEFVLALLLPAIAETIISLALMFFAFGVTVRRLHDVGQSGWWIVIAWAASAISQVYSALSLTQGVLSSGDPDTILEAFASPMMWLPTTVSGVIGIVVFVFCLLDSKPYNNKYGASPKYVTEEEAPANNLQEA